LPGLLLELRGVGMTRKASTESRPKASNVTFHVKMPIFLILKGFVAKVQAKSKQRRLKNHYYSLSFKRGNEPAAQGRWLINSRNYEAEGHPSKPSGKLSLWGFH
jgi:hypothetical protein